MEDKNKLENETNDAAEGIGQQILGELEIIGGILTGDPVTRSEGEFNVETGAIHHQASEDLHSADDANRSDD
ncbi:MAG TPA: hypothetical protein VF596_15800 [Pyrinomonadaceae bacterium]|jgi:hypothetical protein